MTPPTTPTPLLRADGLCCERDGRLLFHDLDLEVGAGQVIQLKGPNGSGKTTLLRSIAGLTSDYAGRVQHLAPFLFQGHRAGINALLTPLENLRWYAMLSGLEVGNDALRAALAAVGLGGYDATPCQFLSAGQQRRVLLARFRFSLDAGGPPLWLLDEPLTALDAAGCEHAGQLFAEQAAAGGAVLCATHQPLTLAGILTLTLGAAA